MSTSAKALVIIDSSLHALWKQQIHKKFADTNAFDIVELNAAEPATAQLTAIYQAYPHPAKNYVFAQKTGTGQEIKLGATTYPGVLDFLAAVSPFTNAAGGGQTLSALVNIDSTFVPGGTAGSDVFQSTLQREVFAGLEGVDAVRFSGTYGDYQVTAPGSSTDTFGAGYVASRNQSATLYDIERLQFSDRSIALDLADGESANTAVRILTAVAGTDSAHDQALLGEVLAYTDQFDLGTLARVLIDAGVLAQFAGGTSDKHLIQHLYANIAGQAPSDADLQWTLGYVADAGLTQAGILEAMINLPHTAARAELVGLAQKGAEYLPYELF